MKSYFRIMLGRKSKYHNEAREGNYVGADFIPNKDMTLPSQQTREQFKKAFIPEYQMAHPEKNKLATGLACGALWTVCREMNIGDRVICPNGDRAYMVGEVTTEYSYVLGESLPHRRGVRWLESLIYRSDMSAELKGSTGAAGTVCDITSYASEIEKLTNGSPIVTALAQDIPTTDESQAEFLLEKYLQQFLVDNWKHTVLGKDYDIYRTEEGDGTEFRTESGRIDILAISKDAKRILVVELKKGRVSDKVVGQLLRYMGSIRAEVAEEEQIVEGVIIALEDDVSLQRAISMVPNVKFYQYEIQFQLLRK